jgi:hypothetical protein
VALLVSLALASPAAALAAQAKSHKKKSKSPPVTVVSATQTTSSDGQILSIPVQCPLGTVAVGGGFRSATAGSPISDLNFVYESRMQGTTGWVISAAREDAGGAGPALALTASADCRSPKLSTKKHKKKKKKLTITDVSATGAGAGNAQTSTATATCAGKTNAIAAGFVVTPPPTLAGMLAYPLIFRDSLAQPKAAVASEVTSGTGTPLSITSHGYCANIPAPIAVSNTGGISPAVSGPTFGSGSVTTGGCRAGKRLLGGGFEATQASTTSAIPVIISSESTGTSWQVSALNLNAFAGNITAIGYCG